MLRGLSITGEYVRGKRGHPKCLVENKLEVKTFVTACIQFSTWRSTQLTILCLPVCTLCFCSVNTCVSFVATKRKTLNLRFLHF